MDVFYNRQGIGDVLILPIKEGDRYELKQETNGDITKITSADGEVLGYNIFHASTYFQLDEKNGAIPLTESLLAEIRTLFQKKGIDDPLEFDLSPKFVVGFVKSKQAHENADKLSVCQIDVGEETLQIVCGAPNIDEGQKVVVAKVGATMPSGMKIKASELRGVPSHGMVCSQKELGLPDAPKEKGIYVLDDTYQIGEEFPF
ncbi:YtpR family tRNA-binding protein [Oceanobacillus oncorhynchi subsp. oncorhynchi]|uniref:YtpR family tRNA-binding protein n=1 Tax=Oceanobacillus TaxID=182709 RepID=UPI0030DBCC53